MQSKFLTVCSLIFLLFAEGAWAGTIYKCKDSQGSLVYQETACAQQAQAVSSWAASEQKQNQETDKAFNGVLVIPQHGNGHYFVEGSINGKPLTFVIDTGASSVVLPRAMAMAAGVYCKDNILMQTANGAASACTGIVSKLGFGPFQIRDVMVMIAPNLSQPLLGMNVLQRYKIDQNDGELRISTKK
jgi:clan AA aspartic protease (TIGR02281 family)